MTGTIFKARQGGTGFAPSTSLSHRTLTVSEDGSDFEAKIAVPTYTTTERNALTNVPENLIIYNSTSTSFQQYQSSSWVNIGGGGGGGSVAWGDITGTLSDQTDLQNALNAKQNTLTNPVVSSSGSPSANQLAVFNATGTQVAPTTTLPTAAMPALTGDITNTAGSLTTTIADNAVTNAKLAQVATQTFKGRTSASTGNVEDLTASQATAILNAMVGDSGSGGTKGLVPAPAAGDAAAGKFLKADGTWATAGGGGGSVPVGTIIRGMAADGDTAYTSAGFLKCDGSVVSQSTYASLYSRVGLLKTCGTSFTTKSRAVTSGWTAIATSGSGSLYVGFVSASAYSSTDLITWTSRTSATASAMNDAAYGSSKFVAVGAGGAIQTSGDGVTWTLRTSNTTSALNNVVWSGSLFVAVGAGGAIVSSPDGVTWTQRTSGTSTAINTVTYANGRFLAVLSSAAGLISSTDGISWSLNTGAASQFLGTNSGSTCNYINGKYVMFGNSGLYLTSSDFTNWDINYLQAAGQFNLGLSFVSNGILYLLGANGAVFTTTDLNTWNRITGVGLANKFCVDSTNIVLAINVGYIQSASNAQYSYNTATSFILPNPSTILDNDSIGSFFGNSANYYIKAT